MADFDFGRGGASSGGVEAPGTARPSKAPKAPKASVATAAPGQDAAAPAPGQDAAAKRAAADSRAYSLFSTDAGPVDRGPDYTYRRLRIHRRDEVNPYADARDAESAADPRSRRLALLAALLVVLLLAAFVLPAGLFTENAGYTLSTWSQTLTQKVGALAQFLVSGTTNGSYHLQFYRYLVIACAGAALGITGAVYQGALKNALAAPSTLGVMSGATLGSVVYVLWVYPTLPDVYGEDGFVYLSEVGEFYASMGPLEYIWTVYGKALCTLAGCFMVVGLILLIARLAGHGRVSNISLIIAGQVFSTVITGVIGLVRYYYVLHDTTGEVSAAISAAQTASFSTSQSLEDLLVVGIPTLLISAVIIRMSTRLNALAFSDVEARSMGLDVRRTRFAMVGLCTALTAVVVAFCGTIGFVGFLVPHLTRKVVGPDFRWLVPASALMGSCFLVGAYFLASMGSVFIASNMSSYISIAGAVVFLVMALRQRGGTRGDWV